VTIEITIKHNNINEPPAETKGVGSPLTGIRPIVIAELINMCEKRIEVRPTITKLEK
tara:strand:+ start:663 stop:833 length:171 start_codon:yes stop_codon:yes gene_type:complete